jgi:hypothetical protein
MRVFAVAVAFILVALARGDVQLEIFEPNREALPGGELVFSGTITNASDFDLDVWGMGWYAPSGFVGEFQPLFFTERMDPHESYTGELFRIVVNTDASYELHSARIDFSGWDMGADDYRVASQMISVAVVPEPASVLGFLLGATLLLCRRRSHATL